MKTLPKFVLRTKENYFKSKYKIFLKTTQDTKEQYKSELDKPRMRLTGLENNEK